MYASRRQLSITPLFVSIDCIFIDLWPIYSFGERCGGCVILFLFLIE